MTQPQHIPFNLALDKLLELIPGHLYCKDKNGKYLWCNKNQLITLGLSSLDDIVGKTDLDICELDAACRIKENDKRIMESGKLEIMEEHGKFGAMESCLSYKAPILDSSGAVIGIIGNSIDNFKQRMLHKSVRDSRDQLINALAKFMDVSKLK